MTGAMTGASAGRPSIGTGGVGMIPTPSGGFAGFAGEPGGPQVGGAPPELPPGLSDHPISLDCSGPCTSAELLGGSYIDPCCTDAGACGANAALLALAGIDFPDRCQARAQPGELDTSCRAKVNAAITVSEQAVFLDPLPGCCRPTGDCGVMVNRLSIGAGQVPLAEPGWGCLEASRFFAGAAPQSCGNEGGAGGAGGAPNQGLAGAPDVGAGGDADG